MSAIQTLLAQVAEDVLRTFGVNWPFLLLSVVLASAVQVYLGTDRLASWLRARTGLAVVGAVVLAALTPFCSCGTTAVVLGALASSVPWAPVVAFMVASPLTSPAEYALSWGLFGAGFATTFFLAAPAIGLVAGWVAHQLERRGLLAHQHRVAAPTEPASIPQPGPVPAVGRTATARAAREIGTVLTLEPTAVPGCCTATDPSREQPEPTRCATGSATSCTEEAPRPRRQQFAAALWANTRRLGLLFFAFTALGYLLIRLIPTSVLTGLLGNDSPLAVPLAALLGIPIYVSSEGSLPMVASLMHGGMGSGAAMAFLITGAGTSIGAVSGMLLIARWRVVALVVGSLVAGATATGYLTPLFV
ncbi:MAG TPA: permease [Nocardioidaceae bacterium]|nr:permease [Nocardioidaceae bacterium]